MYKVYKLIKEGEVVYIGKTVNLKARIKNHLSDKDFDSIAYCACKDGDDMDLVEATLIYRFLPKLNRQFEKYNLVSGVGSTVEEDKLLWHEVPDLTSVKVEKLPSRLVKAPKVNKVEPQRELIKLSGFTNVGDLLSTIHIQTNTEVAMIMINGNTFKADGSFKFDSDNSNTKVRQISLNIEVEGTVCHRCSVEDLWLVKIHGLYYSN